MRCFVGERYCSLPKLLILEEECMNVEKVLRMRIDPIIRSYESVEAVIVGRKQDTEKFIVSFNA